MYIMNKAVKTTESTLSLPTYERHTERNRFCFTLCRGLNIFIRILGFSPFQQLRFSKFMKFMINLHGPADLNRHLPTKD